MQWQNIPATTLLQDYGAWIMPRLVSNNRIIGLLGLADTPYQVLPDAQAWILRRTDGRILQIIAQGPKEIALVNHPDFCLDHEQVRAICQHFRGSWVLICHEDQCEKWEIAARAHGFKDVPLLATRLYQLVPDKLRNKPLPAELRLEALPRYTPQIGRFIQGFMLDVLQQKIDEDEARQRFGKREFFGLFQGEQLLSIAALTHRLMNGRCLSYVYTPPKLRGQDYAGLTVEHLCRQIFQNPTMNLIFLYADESNPSSNRLYQKLGFEMVCVSKTF
jgi:RimJ/RimL family protein N-acetyltransferase